MPHSFDLSLQILFCFVFVEKGIIGTKIINPFLMNGLLIVIIWVCPHSFLGALGVILNFHINWAASWKNQQCGFRTGPTQTVLYKHRSRLEARNFVVK